MAAKKITVPDLCSEKFSKMSPSGEGRMCSKCNSIVIDFRKMSDEELIKTIESGKYDCGRFTGAQLNKLYEIGPIAPSVVLKPRVKPYWAGIAAAIIAGVLQISTSYSQTTTSNSSKLIARDKHFARTEPKTEKEKEDNTNKISFKILGADLDGGIRDVNIILPDLGITTRTDVSGKVECSLKKDLDIKQIITVKIDCYGYKSKTIKLNLEKWVNKTKVIHLNKKRYRRFESYGGVYAFID